MSTTTTPCASPSRQVHRQAIAEEALIALEQVINRHRHDISAVEVGGSGTEVNPDVLAGELAGQLANLRSKLHRYTQLG